MHSSLVFFVNLLFLVCHSCISSDVSQRKLELEREINETNEESQQLSIPSHILHNQIMNITEQLKEQFPEETEQINQFATCCFHSHPNYNQTEVISEFTTYFDLSEIKYGVNIPSNSLVRNYLNENYHKGLFPSNNKTKLCIEDLSVEFRRENENQLNNLETAMMQYNEIFLHSFKLSFKYFVLSEVEKQLKNETE
uniref:Hypotheticial protein n=1 Tax=Schistosoma japonicum TaxID=6182 RepID=C1LHP1_SCHJA|nr:hypotheticial protein [Schistosoma japonicum]